MLPSWLTLKVVAIAGGLVLASAGVWILILRADLASTETKLVQAESDRDRYLGERDMAVAANAAAARVLEELKAEQTRLNTVLSAERERNAETQQQLTDALQEIARAPETDNAPVSPVLQRTLDRVRGRAAADGGGP